MNQELVDRLKSAEAAVLFLRESLRDLHDIAGDYVTQDAIDLILIMEDAEHALNVTSGYAQND